MTWLFEIISTMLPDVQRGSYLLYIWSYSSTRSLHVSWGSRSRREWGKANSFPPMARIRGCSLNFETVSPRMPQNLGRFPDIFDQALLLWCAQPKTWGWWTQSAFACTAFKAQHRGSSILLKTITGHTSRSIGQYVGTALPRLASPNIEAWVTLEPNLLGICQHSHASVKDGNTFSKKSLQKLGIKTFRAGTARRYCVSPLVDRWRSAKSKSWTAVRWWNLRTQKHDSAT